MDKSLYDEFSAFYDEYVSSQFYDEVLMPALWEIVPPVDGMRVCDIACGQGIVARGLAARGAKVVGVDASERLLELAHQHERERPLGIDYVWDDAQSLTSLGDRSFAGAVCNMALMDIPDAPAVFRAVHRILSPGSWFVFAITHPCWEAPEAVWARDEIGRPVRIVSRYATEGFWREHRNPTGLRFRVGAHHRTVSSYVNALAAAGFFIERMDEPPSTGARLDTTPGNAEMPSILLVRARAG